jgi:hypothetical protein
MRRTLLVAAAGVVMAALLAVTSSRHANAGFGIAKFQIVPGFQAAPIGHPYPIEYEIKVDDVIDPDGLGAFQFDLQFDPSAVAWAAPGNPADARGPFLGSTGRAVSCIGPSLIAPDTIRFRCATLGSTPNGPTGGGIVARLNFIQLNQETQGWFDFLGHGEETKATDITGTEIPSELVTFATDSNDVPHEGQIAIVSCYDFDGDGIDTILDVAMVAGAFQLTPSDPGWDPRFDLDGDNVITVIDIAKVSAAFGLTCPET